MATASALGVVVLGGVGFVRHARLTIPYLVIVLGLAVVVAASDDHARYSRLSLMGLSAWGLMHLAGGLIVLDDGRILYNVVVLRWVHLDNVVHFIGFGSAGVAACEALTASLSEPLRPRVAFTVALIAAAGFGAINEVIEFGASHALEGTNVGGFQNTGRDLVANLLGGCVAGFICRRRVLSDP